MAVLEVECIARMQDWLKARKSIDIKHLINRIKNMMHMSISMFDRECLVKKMFDKKINILSR